MLEAVSHTNPSMKFAEAAYMLQKELGITHSELFGERRVIEDSDGDGGIVRKVVRGKGMNAKTFVTYLNLMEKRAEEQEKQRKKQKMRKSVKGMGM